MQLLDVNPAIIVNIALIKCLQKVQLSTQTVALFRQSRFRTGRPKCAQFTVYEIQASLCLA